MSYMCSAIAIRAIQEKSISELYEISKSVFGEEANDISKKYNSEEISYFKYEGKHPIAVYEIKGKICLDYILNENTDVDYINESIELKKVNKIKSWLKKSGFDVKNVSIKIIYYHNGGCAGLCEVF